MASIQNDKELQKRIEELDELLSLIKDLNNPTYYEKSIMDKVNKLTDVIYEYETEAAILSRSL